MSIVNFASRMVSTLTHSNARMVSTLTHSNARMVSTIPNLIHIPYRNHINKKDKKEEPEKPIKDKNPKKKQYDIIYIVV